MRRTVASIPLTVNLAHALLQASASSSSASSSDSCSSTSTAVGDGSSPVGLSLPCYHHFPFLSDYRLEQRKLPFAADDWRYNDLPDQWWLSSTQSSPLELPFTCEQQHLIGCCWLVGWAGLGDNFINLISVPASRWSQSACSILRPGVPGSDIWTGRACCPRWCSLIRPSVTSLISSRCAACVGGGGSRRPISPRIFIGWPFDFYQHELQGFPMSKVLSPDFSQPFSVISRMFDRWGLPFVAASPPPTG